MVYNPNKYQFGSFEKMNALVRTLKRGNIFFLITHSLVLKYTVPWDATVCESIVRSRKRTQEKLVVVLAESKGLSFKKCDSPSFAQQVPVVTSQVKCYRSESSGRNQTI